MLGHLFITAPTADFKLANRLLVSLKYEDDTDIDFFHLIRSKNAYEVATPDADEPNPTDEAGSFTSDNFHNAWAGSSLQDVEAFALDTLAHNADTPDGQIYHFVLLDEQGLQDQTCIYAHRHRTHDDHSNPDDEAPDQSQHQYEYDKIRVPWDEVQCLWVNLEIANMNFEEFCEDDEAQGGAREGGWWTYKECGIHGTRNRDDLLATLMQEGKA